jgi:hypothetical protein
VSNSPAKAVGFPNREPREEVVGLEVTALASMSTFSTGPDIGSSSRGAAEMNGDMFDKTAMTAISRTVGDIIAMATNGEPQIEKETNQMLSVNFTLQDSVGRRFYTRL